LERFNSDPLACRSIYFLLQTKERNGGCEMSFTILGYRVRYYWRKFVNFIGFCHRCGSSVNYTSYGKAICPNCGK
jgi:hypothetical protein